MPKYSNSDQFEVPDIVFKLAYEGYVKRYGKIQGLQQMKDRGGFGIQEILDFISIAMKDTMLVRKK